MLTKVKAMYSVTYEIITHHVKYFSFVNKLLFEKKNLKVEKRLSLYFKFSYLSDI